MLKKLSNEQQQWVEQTLESMTIEDCVGQLLMPEDRKGYTIDTWLEILEQVPLGCLFFGKDNGSAIEQKLRVLQSKSRIPLLIAGDLEHGATALADEGTAFPWMMAAGAANDPELIYEMGRATAKQGRYRGFHWTFAPVADINFNYQNPVTNIRALSDDPDRVRQLLEPLITGMQEESLIAAAAKHFPGDGVDDRDQHLCTSVNSMPLDQWYETYGKVWKTVIDAGTMTIMSGHISLPAYEGYETNPEEALPATLSKKLQVDLLREKLGFEGVIVSDAAPMIGLTSRVCQDDMVIQNIASGSDVFLFANPIEDFKRLMKAVEEGRLTAERVRASARRVLELKARLNIHLNPFGSAPTVQENKHFGEKAMVMAQKSITMLKSPKQLPNLQAGDSVLTVTVRYDNPGFQPLDLTTFDQELEKRGLKVEHLLNPSHNTLIDVADDYDAIFYNMYITPHQLIGTIEMTGHTSMAMWRDFSAGRDNVYFTSFGTPYSLYERPHLANFAATFSPEDYSQQAAVQAWLGEIPFKASSPVKLPKVTIKRVDY